MGINLWDIGAFATGAIERDREHTAENLKIRADELAAKRNSLIRRKDKKYDMEIETYKKERAKANEIASLNAAYVGKKVDPFEYAWGYLSLTDKNWSGYDKTERDRLAHKKAATIGEGQQGAFTYQMHTKDPDKLAALQSKEEDIILSNYATQLKAAKDDSFLINKILGKKTTDSSSADLEKIVKDEVSAGDIITKLDDSEKKADTTTLDFSKLEALKVNVPEKYAAAVKEIRSRLGFKSVSDKENAIDYLTASHWLNADGAGYYKIDDTGKVTKSTASGKALMKTYQDTYNHVLNSIKDSTLYTQDQSIGNIEAIFNPTILHNITQNLLRTRGSNMDETGWFDGKKDMKVIAMVPVNILDTSNKIDFGDGAVEVDSQKVRDKYEEFLRLITKEDAFQSKLVSQLDNDVDKVMAVQQDLEDDGPYTDTFKTWLKDQDIYLKEEVKVTDDKDTPSKFKVSLTKDGSPGIELNGKVYKIRDNLEYLQSIDDTDLQKAITDALNEYTGMKKAPHSPSKYLDTTGVRGTKKINPAWQKLQDLEKSLTAVKPKKTTKKKIR